MEDSGHIPIILQGEMQYSMMVILKSLPCYLH